MEREVDLLGELAVRPGNAPAGPRLRALLVLLALAGGRPVDAGALVEDLWGATPPADEAGALQSLVSRLRRSLPVLQSGGGYRLALSDDAVDALRAERLVDRAEQALREGSPAVAAPLLGDALGLLERAPVPEVPAAVAVRLGERRRAAVVAAADADLARGVPVGRLPALQQACDDDPLDERAAGLLVRALAGAGRPAQALQAYDRLRRELAEQLGLDPAPALQALSQELLRDTGDAPAAAAAPARAWWTSFVGREGELHRVEELLLAGRLVTVLGPGGSGKTRLAGETARRLAGRAVDVRVVELAPVTDPSDVPRTVLAALGRRETAVLDRAGRPREVTGVLLDALADRELVLVLDNCEHLVDAAAALADTLLARCPRLRVLATSREPLGIDGEALAPLAPLAVPPEGATAAEAAPLPAVRLLVDRAAAVSPGFRLDEGTVTHVVEVVRRLDGLPLAIELAAARLRTLPVAEVAARLGDRFRLLTGGSRAVPRHRTLRAVVAWSWDLLSPEESLLADRVAVFAGTVTPGSAAEVCAGEGLAAADVPDLLAALVDKSLLQRVPGAEARYRVLETLREYGLERLAGRGELGRLRDRHAVAYARLAAESDPLLRGPQQGPALDRLRAEHDDLLAALRHLCDGLDAAPALCLGLDLAWYWQMLGRHEEATTTLTAALRLPGGDRADRLAAEAVAGLSVLTALDDGLLDATDGRPRLRAVASELAELDLRRPVAALAVPVVLYFAGDPERGRREVERLTAGSDRWLAASALLFRSRVHDNDGRPDASCADAEAALAVFRRNGDDWGTSACLQVLAGCRQYEGDLDGALAALEEAERRGRALGRLDVTDEAMLALRLAELQTRRGDSAAARQAEDRARARVRRGGPAEFVAIVDALVGGTARQRGDVATARRRQRDAEHALAAGPGSGWPAHGSAIVQACGAALDVAVGDPAAAGRRLRRAHADAVSTRDLPIIAVVGVVQAAHAAATGRPAVAAELLGAAAGLRGADDPTGLDVRTVQEACRRELGDEAYGRAYAAGRTLDATAAQALLGREASRTSP